MFATCAANRPNTAPLASITCHLRWSKFTFGKCVFISNPNQRKSETIKEMVQVNSLLPEFESAIKCDPVSDGGPPGGSVLRFFESVLAKQMGDPALTPRPHAGSGLVVGGGILKRFRTTVG